MSSNEGRKSRVREASATDVGECNWAAIVAPDALLMAGGDMLERLYHANRELFEFWRGRIDCFGDVSRRIAACRSIEDIQQIQSRYAEDMLRAYAAMGSRLPGLLFRADTMSDAARAPEGSTRVA